MFLLFACLTRSIIHDAVPVQEGIVRMNALPSGWHIMAVDNSSCSVTYISVFDQKLIASAENPSDISKQASRSHIKSNIIASLPFFNWRHTSWFEMSFASRHPQVLGVIHVSNPE